MDQIQDRHIVSEPFIPDPPVTGCSVTNERFAFREREIAAISFRSQHRSESFRFASRRHASPKDGFRTPTL